MAKNARTMLKVLLVAYSLFIPFFATAYAGQKNADAPDWAQAKPSASTTPADKRIEREILSKLAHLSQATGLDIAISALRLTKNEAVIVLKGSIVSGLNDIAFVERLVKAAALAAHPKTKLRFLIETPQGELPLDAFVKDAPRPLMRSHATRSGQPSVRPSGQPTGFPKEGVLSGRTIVISPGHGWYWVDSLGGWFTQRGEVYGIIEDFTNSRLAMHTMRALEAAGAYVISCRERDFNTTEIIVDNDYGRPVYSSGAAFTDSEYSGYQAGGYQVAATVADPDDESLAEFLPSFPSNGNYSVYAQWRAGENRVTDARFLIRHAGGETEILVNQQINDLRWIYLGNYDFHEGGNRGQGVLLSNYSGEVGYVIADAVKFGGGMGSLARGGSTSGKPRWQMAARYWVEYVGAPGWVYREELADNAADVTVRPYYADWQGGDLYLSLHTNAAGSGNVGYGTETYTYNGAPFTGSERWRDLLHDNVVEAIRARWDGSWVNRGKKSANFGELRELSTMPGALIEVGFHDTETDAFQLKRPYFRQTVARAMAKAAITFFAPNAPIYPMPVRDLRVFAVDESTLKLEWDETPDPVWGEEASASSYRIYVSRNGYGFDNGAISVTEKSYIFEDAEPGVTYAFKVAAVNSSGESLPSEPMVARFDGHEMPSLLIVNGFDRLDRSIQEEENTRDYALTHAAAIADAGNYGFVSASNEAVAKGLVDLSPYWVVDWIAGEEARLGGEEARFHALDIGERHALEIVAERGGAILITGSEIGWDVVVAAEGDSAYLDFYTNTMKAQYLSDDADDYDIFGIEGSIFDGLSGEIDDGSHGAYDVDWPELIAPTEGAQLCLRYSDAEAGAGVCYDGEYKLVYLGVPLEAVVTAQLRASMMRRVLEFFYDGEPPEAIDGDEDWPAYEIDWQPPDEEREADGDYEKEAEPLPDGDEEEARSEHAEDERGEDADVHGAVADGDGEDGALVCPPGMEEKYGECYKKKKKDDGCSQTGAPIGFFLVIIMLSALVFLRRKADCKA